jgi:hypothetical protein
MQSEETGDKENDDDDADDVENVHGILRLRHARFQHESAALQKERSCRQVGSEDQGSYSATTWSILYRVTPSMGMRGSIIVSVRCVRRRRQLLDGYLGGLARQTPSLRDNRPLKLRVALRIDQPVDPLRGSHRKPNRHELAGRRG